MGQQYDNELRGVLFKNDRRQKPEHPEYQGACQIEGKEYWVSAWVKEPKSAGKGKFFSLAFTAKDKQFAKKDQQSSGNNEFDDDDIPF